MALMSVFAAKKGQRGPKYFNIYTNISEIKEGCFRDVMDICSFVYIRFIHDCMAVCYGRQC